jgi:hypothetical protein
MFSTPTSDISQLQKMEYMKYNIYAFAVLSRLNYYTTEWNSLQQCGNIIESPGRPGAFLDSSAQIRLSPYQASFHLPFRLLSFNYTREMI